jgi:hypothetical protein
MEDNLYSPEEIKKKFASLPSDIKTLVYSADMLTVLKQVAEKYHLHIDKIEILEGETADVMTGFSAPNKFVDNLVENLGIDKTKAEGIAKDIDEMLFSKIRDAMKKAYEQSTTAPEKSVIMPSAVAAPAPAPLPTDMQIEPPIAPAPVKATTPPPQMHEADVMLSEPTVSLPTNPSNSPATSLSNPPKKVETAPTPTKVEAPKPPASYKADPYREPIE